LQLPDAGEFSLEGGGTIQIEEGKLVLQYESKLLGYEGEDGWVEANEVVKEYTGTKTITD
jgi:hypothetical protein